jgi:hypothetical protein
MVRARSVIGGAVALAVLPDGTTCAFRSLVDLRRVCTGLMDTDAEWARFYVQYDRWLN